MSGQFNIITFYAKLLKEAFGYFNKHALFMYIGVLYVGAIVVTAIVTGPLPMFGFLINALVQSACLSSYVYIAKRASMGYRVDWDDVRDGLYAYTRVILGIIMLNSFMLIVFAYLRLPIAVAMLYVVVVFLLLNALPEIISNKGLFVIDSIKYAANFELKYILEWFIPNLIVLFPFLFGYLTIMRGATILNVNLTVQLALIFVITLIVAQYVIGILLIFRQLLFRQLDNGNFKRRFRVIK